jgi:hypothetical protein
VAYTSRLLEFVLEHTQWFVGLLSCWEGAANKQREYFPPINSKVVMSPASHGCPAVSVVTERNSNIRDESNDVLQLAASDAPFRFSLRSVGLDRCRVLFSSSFPSPDYGFSPIARVTLHNSTPPLPSVGVAPSPSAGLVLVAASTSSFLFAIIDFLWFKFFRDGG